MCLHCLVLSDCPHNEKVFENIDTLTKLMRFQGTSLAIVVDMVRGEITIESHGINFS